MPSQVCRVLVIDFNVRIEGSIVAPAGVTIIGMFSGVLQCADLRIDPRARVTGTLVARRIQIDGYVSGDIYADHLRLGETSTVHGRIFHGELELPLGAYFEGQSRRHQDPRSLFSLEQALDMTSLKQVSAR